MQIILFSSVWGLEYEVKLVPWLQHGLEAPPYTAVRESEAGDVASKTLSHSLKSSKGM